MPITTLNKYNTDIHGVDARINRITEVRRRINKRFGKGTFQVKTGDCIRLNTPHGITHFLHPRHMGDVYGCACYDVILPVLNMLIAVGALRITELRINTRQPGETRLAYKQEAL